MKFFKKRNDEATLDDGLDFYDNEEYYNAPSKDGESFDADEAEQADRSGVSFSGSGAPVALKVVRPGGYDEAPEIADFLASGSTVLLNIEQLDKNATKRLLDFLLGATHVLGGTMNKVAKGTFVFAPKNVGVSDLTNANEEAEEVIDIAEEETII